MYRVEMSIANATLERVNFPHFSQISYNLNTTKNA